MCGETGLDELYLDTPAGELMNDAEAALFERLRGDWRGELRSIVRGREATLAGGRGVLPADEDLLREGVEAFIGRLCQEDAKVQVGGRETTLTMDLIEVDVRPALLASALMADGCLDGGEN